MTTDPTYRTLLERSWRRPLTAAEDHELRAWLAKHPDAALDWEVEAGINRALGGLGDAPLPSNFTALVIAAVEQQAHEASRRGSTLWMALSRWLPRTAVAAIVFGVGMIAYVHNSHNAEMARIVQSVETVSDVRSLPSPRILQDFEAIRELKPAAAKPDVVLLSLLE